MTRRVGRTTRGVLLSLALLFATACSGAQTVNVRTTPIAPGGDVEITATPDSAHGVTRLKVVMLYVPRPQRINPEAKAFVVWARRDETASWLRLGAMSYDPIDREARLETAYAETRFEVQITLENAPDPEGPMERVLATVRFPPPER